MTARHPAPRARRRQPRQRRARLTIDAILEAAVKVLKRGGVDALTTNRIAMVAGVSVGSIYQYFPDKHAIFQALHDRHVADASRRIDATLVEHAGASPRALVRALFEALIEAHAPDPELYALLDGALPHGDRTAGTVQERLRSALRLAIAARMNQTARDLEPTLFVLSQMLDALAHGAILNRPPQLSLAAAKNESLAAITRYLDA